MSALSITNPDRTAQEIVAELCSELSLSEKIRLLGWANAPRLDEIREVQLKRKRMGDMGPSDGPEPQKVLNAVAGR